MSQSQTKGQQVIIEPRGADGLAWMPSGSRILSYLGEESGLLSIQVLNELDQAHPH